MNTKPASFLTYFQEASVPYLRHKGLLPLMSLSLLLVACNPGTPAPGHLGASQTGSALHLLTNQRAQLTLRIQGDANLQKFGLQQAQGVCLNELKALRFSLQLSHTLQQGEQLAFQNAGFDVNGKTLSKTLMVHQLGDLIKGYDLHLPQPIEGEVKISTDLMSVSGQVLGSMNYQTSISSEDRIVSVLIKSLDQIHAAQGCPVLTTDISGATLNSLSGGLMLLIQPPAGSAGQAASSLNHAGSPLFLDTFSASSVTYTPGHPVLPPSNLQVVASSSGSLTLVWNAPYVNTAQTYRVYLNGQQVANNLAGNYYTFHGLQPNTSYTLEVETLVGDIASSSKAMLSSKTTASGTASGGGIHMSNWQQGSPVTVINNISNSMQGGSTTSTIPVAPAATPTPSLGSWTQLASAYSWQTRTDFAAGALNNQLYVYGGASGTLLQRYDVGSNSWSDLGHYFPSGGGDWQSFYSQGSVSGNDFYVLNTSSGALGSDFGRYNTNYGWSSASVPSQSRTGFSLATLGSYIYMVGGYDASGNYSSRVDRYSPSSNSWTEVASMPTPRSHLAAAVVNNKLYAVGGQSYFGFSGQIGTLEVFDPSQGVSGSWSSLASMPTPRHSLTAQAIDNKIYAIGASGTGSITSLVEVYDTVQNTWSTAASMPTGRSGLASAVINNQIYAVGGSASGISGTMVLERYTP